MLILSTNQIVLQCTKHFLNIYFIINISHFAFLLLELKEKFTARTCPYCCSVWRPNNVKITFKPRLKITPKIRRLLERSDNNQVLGKYQAKVVKEFKEGNNKLVCLDEPNWCSLIPFIAMDDVMKTIQLLLRYCRCIRVWLAKRIQYKRSSVDQRNWKKWIKVHQVIRAPKYFMQ